MEVNYEKDIITIFFYDTNIHVFPSNGSIC